MLVLVIEKVRTLTTAIIELGIDGFSDTDVDTVIIDFKTAAKHG